MNSPIFGMRLDFLRVDSISRRLVISVFCLFLTSCAPIAQQTKTVSSEPAISADDASSPPVISHLPEIEIIAPDVPIISESDELDVPAALFDEYAPWTHITQTNSNALNRSSNLLNAANSLFIQNRIAEAESIVKLIRVNELSESERIDFEILAIRFMQSRDKHKRALRQLARLESRSSLDSAQRFRVVRLRIYSTSNLDELAEPLQLALEMMRFYSALPPGSDQIEVGHQLWDELRRISIDDLAEVLTNTDNPIEKQWLLLALGTNFVMHDPYQYNRALQTWLQEYPEHPARRLIESGLSANPSSVSKIAILLPLSSSSNLAAQALLDGLVAQHAADTNPAKPILEVIDIGDDPVMVTEFYYRALDNGADFVIGPLGKQFVKEMVQFGDFIVPTLLLGDAGGIKLPQHVSQFALAPEQDGTSVARRAKNDGHTTALVLEHPSTWSRRTVDAFTDEWERLGGAVIESHVYNREETDYSETVKKILNIKSSVHRYQEIRDLTGHSLSFIPRRRQDVDFIFLSADPLHGRLIKPHIDFLKAHDLPVYSTSHIFSGKFNKITDQDLDGVQFADMNWIVDRSSSMVNLRRILAADTSITIDFERIFAMGVDAYKLVMHLAVLRDNPDARYHGVTALIRVNSDGRVLREPNWVMFSSGTPELIIEMPDPEIILTPNRYASSSPSAPPPKSEIRE